MARASSRTVPSIEHAAYKLRRAVAASSSRRRHFGRCGALSLETSATIPHSRDDGGDVRLVFVRRAKECEILSADYEATDRGTKMRIYRRESVRHAWLINPVSRTLEIYRLEEGRWEFFDVFEGDAVVRAEPFDAMELSLSVLWERLRTKLSLRPMV
jgi:hypothetical protein